MCPMPRQTWWVWWQTWAENGAAGEDGNVSPNKYIGRGREREGAQGHGQDEEGARPGGPRGTGSTFFETLGGAESPGMTWMLIFTAKGKLEKGSYFPVTAVQCFDAAWQRIKNGVYLGPAGCLSFEGRLSWKKMLAFLFERVRVKLGPLPSLEIPLFFSSSPPRASTHYPGTRSTEQIYNCL